MKKKYIDDADKEWWEKGIQSEENSKRYYSRIYNGIKFEIHGKVLSIGEGQGYFLNWLGIKNATIIDVCREEKKFGYKRITRDISKKLRINKKFDTIFIMEVLEHMRNPLYLIAQVYDLLEDNGVCYVSVPYTKINPNSEDILTHKVRWKDYEIKKQMWLLGFRVKFLLKRLRFKNTAFFLPHCFLVMELRK